MQQSSVKDEFNNSSSAGYAGADYSLQNLDSYYKSNSSTDRIAESNSANSQQESQQPPTTVKSDVDYSVNSAPSILPTTTSNEHVSSHYDYPAYYSTV